MFRDEFLHPPPRRPRQPFQAVPLLHKAMVSEPEPAHMRRGNSGRHGPRYGDGQRGRRGGALLPYVYPWVDNSGQLGSGYVDDGISAERDSPRDQLVVSLFLLTVFGLLLGAGIKGRMVKAGLDPSLPWHTGRKWWQVGLPSLSSRQNRQ